MRHAFLKSLCLVAVAFSSSKAGAQNFKFPLFYQPAPKSAFLKNYQLAQLQSNYLEDSSKAILLSQQKNFTLYALPLDNTPCLASNEPADKNINAWKPDNNNGFNGTIPNALKIRDILPQKTAPLLLLSK